MSVERANDLLRYAILVLKGERVVSRDSGRVHIALILRDRLEDAGYWWQVKILSIWLNRFYRAEGSDLPIGGGEGFI